MQTIIVLLDPGKLENADMDLSYCVPDRIEEVSGFIFQPINAKADVEEEKMELKEA